MARMTASIRPPSVAAIDPKVIAMSVEKRAARIAVVMMSAAVHDLIHDVAPLKVRSEWMEERRLRVDRRDVDLILERHEERRDVREEEEEQHADESDESDRFPRHVSHELDQARQRTREPADVAPVDRGRGHRHFSLAPPARPMRGSSLV